ARAGMSMRMNAAPESFAPVVLLQSPSAAVRGNAAVLPVRTPKAPAKPYRRAAAPVPGGMLDSLPDVSRARLALRHGALPGRAARDHRRIAGVRSFFKRLPQCLQPRPDASLDRPQRLPRL